VKTDTGEANVEFFDDGLRVPALKATPRLRCDASIFLPDLIDEVKAVRSGGNGIFGAYR
jgi:hypothetical protein